MEQYSRIDRGEPPQSRQEAHDWATTPEVVFYSKAAPEARQRLRDEAGVAIRPIAEEPAYALGQRIRESTGEAFPVAPEHEGRFPVQLGRGIGSTATFLGTGLVGRLLRLPILPVVAGTGAIANSSEVFRDAIDRGAGFEDAYRASRMAGVVGTSEALPIVKLLGRLDDASGGQIRRLIVRAAQGGIEEGAQELFQSVAENLIASDLVAYDPERGTFQGTGDAAGVGFTVGALMNFLASMLGVKMRRSPQQVTEQTVREFAEHAIREPEGVPTPAGRPAERGEPFQRPQAPAEPAPAPVAPVPPPAPPAAEPTLPPGVPRTVFRGHGRTEQGEAYSGPAVPILGPGRYYAFSREAAEKFGPDVEQAEFAPKNPLVIRSDEEWRALTKEAGWEFPNPYGLEETQIRQQTDRLQEIVRRRGHDAIVVTWDDTTQTDTDRLGNRIKTLRNVFGQPQALLFDEVRPAPEAPPVPAVKARGRLSWDALPESVKNAVAASRREGDRGVAWAFDHGGGRADMEALNRLLVERKHPLAKHPGTDEGRFRRVVADLVREREDIKNLDQRTGEEGPVPTPAGPPEPPAVFTSEAEGRPDLPPAAGAPKRVKIPPEAGIGVPETTEVKGPDGSVRVEVVRKKPAETGMLGEIKFKSTKRSTESYLDEAARRRTARTLTKDQKALAEEARKSNLAAFDAAHQELVRRTYAGTQGGVEPEGVEIETITARDKRTIFRFPATEEGVEELLATKKRYEKLPAQTTGYGMQVPDLENIRAQVDRGLGRQTEAEGALPETAYAVVAGESYRGMVQDKVEGVAPAVATKPLRREDILRPLLKALNVPLYQGRMKGRKFLGFYRRHIEEVRIKRMNDIEVASHELAHMLDDRIPEIRAQWLPATKANKEIRDELRGVSYDKSKLFEGFAEFMRLWSTQREEAKARAPKFYGWFEDFLTRNEYGPALRKAQEQMHAWFAQDAVSRARSKIGVTEEINAGLTRPFSRFRQAVADDLHGIYRMERELTGGINPVGAYETARLTRGKHAIIEGALLYGAPVVQPDGSHAFEGKGLSQILDPVASQLDDFLMYAVGRSARELMFQGRERLFTPAEVKGMVALETPAFRKAFDEYQVWNKAILDFAEKKGVISPFFRATWKRAQYLPFHRVGQPGAFSPVPGDWKGIKALTGGTDNLRDILGNMIGNASMLIDAALTNEARLEVANLARQRGGAHFMAKIPKEERITKVHRDEIERAILEALGVERKAQLPIEQQIFIDQIVNGMGAMVPLIQRGQTPYGGNVVAVLNQGKPEFYEVADPLLYRALTHLNRPSKGALLRLLSGVRRISQLSITLDPSFLFANIARDTVSGTIMSRHGFKPFKDSALGLISRLKSDPNYRDFIANGGGFSSYFTEEAAFKKHLERFYTRKGIDYKTVLDTPSKFLYAVERIADAFEMATRLGEYRKAIRKGEHPRHAAYSGREVSTDFAMRGDWAPIGYAYDSIIFIKAAVNGLDRLYRGVGHDQNRAAIAGRVAALAMLSAGLSAMWRGIPDYDDMTDYDRDNHWHFYPPKLETIQAWAEGRPLPPIEERYWHFRYPKIWEIGAISSIAERTLTRLLDDEAGELPEDFARILLDTFRVEYMPQIIAPVFEAGVPFTEFKGINRRRFFDRPIQAPRLLKLQPWARATPYTSTTLRKLGEATRKLPRGSQVVPVQVEALLRGFFNSWAMYGLQLSDAVFFDDAPDIPVDRYPVARRFYERSPLRRTKYGKEFYEMLNLASAARATMRDMDRTYRPQFADELEQTRENLEYEQLTAANKEVRGIIREINSVMRAPDLATLHELAKEMARNPSYRPKIARLRRSKDWRDLGALKAELLDLTIMEKNKHTKTVVLDIKAQRKQRRAAR